MTGSCSEFRVRFTIASATWLCNPEHHITQSSVESAGTLNYSQLSLFVLWSKNWNVIAQFQTHSVAVFLTVILARRRLNGSLRFITRDKFGNSVWLMNTLSVSIT